MRDIEVAQSAPPASPPATARATASPTSYAPPSAAARAAAATPQPSEMPGVRHSAPAVAMKRLLDVLISAIVLLILMPLFAVVAVAIKLDSPGPVVFRQRRLGKGGKPFIFLKFRTMVNGNDSAIHQEYITKLMRDCSEKLKGENGSFKIESDPRVTRVGRALRRLSIDELPQFVNVLRGEMSVVGPRPPLDYEVALYTEREWHRLDVLPGITGLWQVSGRCETTFEEMVELDLTYAQTWSVWSDLKIIARTPLVVLDRKGAW